MRVLGIDTSAGIALALLGADGVVAESYHPDGRAHAEELTPAISALVAAAGAPNLAAAGIDLVAVGTGPAPFTGLRAGLVTARTIAHLLAVPVVGVCSLDALARQALDRLDRDAEVQVVTDAKRRELYRARYRAAGANDVERLSEPEVGAPAVAANVPASVLTVGPGVGLYAATFPAAPMLVERVDAAVLARLGRDRWAAAQAAAAAGTEVAADLGTEPLYLRRPDIHQGGAGQRRESTPPQAH